MFGNEFVSTTRPDYYFDMPQTEKFTQTAAVVRELAAVSARYWRLKLHAPTVAQTALPGQFVMLRCRDARDAGLDPLLPRPLALLDANRQSGELQLLFFVGGRGTEILRESAKPGAEFLLIGPLGKGFEPIPGANVHIGVGGGSGVAPLVFFFRQGFSSRLITDAAKPKKILILGARTAAHLPAESAVAAPDTALICATDDGSTGFHGHAVQALEQLPEFGKGVRAAVYAAGPEPMMRAAAAAAKKVGAACRVSLEQHMACGVGVCRGCIVDGTTPHPQTGLKRRVVCCDGPVFDPSELADWQAPE